MKLVVGIGNPGRRYAGTRHNLGACVVDRLAAQHAIAVSRRRFHALVGDGTIGSQRARLVKPETFVNLSGSAVAPLLRWHRCSLDDLLVVCDDINLEPGRLRLRPRGSSGGHNGLKSIAECLASTEFARLRLGIGRGRAGEPTDHVLGRFTPAEQEWAAEVVVRAAEVVRHWLDKGTEAAMTACNG